MNFKQNYNILFSDIKTTSYHPGHRNDWKFTN